MHTVITNQIHPSFKTQNGIYLLQAGLVFGGWVCLRIAKFKRKHVEQMLQDLIQDNFTNIDDCKLLLQELSEKRNYISVFLGISTLFLAIVSGVESAIFTVITLQSSEITSLMGSVSQKNQTELVNSLDKIIMGIAEGTGITLGIVILMLLSFAVSLILGYRGSRYVLKSAILNLLYEQQIF